MGKITYFLEKAVFFDMTGMTDVTTSAKDVKAKSAIIIMGYVLLILENKFSNVFVYNKYPFRFCVPVSKYVS
jgi:hypothetical protein